MVAREVRGASVYYRLTDESVDALCDLVCGNIARRLEQASATNSAFRAAL